MKTYLKKTKNIIWRVKPFVAILMCLAMVVVFCRGVLADGKESGQNTAEKLRIGYCQAGAYYEFDYEIYQIGCALVESGEFTCEELGCLKQGDGFDVVWKALAAGESEFYEFGKDCCMDLTSSDFYGLSEEEQGEKLDNMIREKKIDLMITMGTVAGQAVKNYSDVPYMNFIASDPVSSQITQGAEFSGDARGWAHINEGVEQRALEVMYDLFEPKTVGIVYNGDDPEAYVYSGAASVDAIAAEKDMRVFTEYVSDEFDDTQEAYQNYLNEMLTAHKKLAKEGVDLYILTTSYLELEDFYEVLYPFMEAGIPVFSINSTEDVRCGALAAVEMYDYQNIGRFAADILKQYREGADLGQLPQQYATAPFLVLNIDTMHQTGVKLPFDILLSASKIYGRYQGE